jgi:AmmeMemoRadiSam system protein A
LDFDPDLRELAAEDAVDSALVAASAVNWNAAGHKVLSYEGPFGVGYGVAILYQTLPQSGLTGGCEREAAEFGRELTRLARCSLEAAFRGDSGVPDIPTPGILAERHGVFVTIRGPRRKLRGCVGTLTPRFANIAEETWHVARDAAFHDGRFTPVDARELERLRFEVSVVLPPEEVASLTELDPDRFGVIVSADDGRRGVLLPDVRGVETVEQQLDCARRKGDIDELEPVRLQRFAVKKFSEAD